MLPWIRINSSCSFGDKNIDKSKREKILSKIKERLEELLENHIYLYDFTVRNILYNPLNDNVEIVDFEDSLCYEEERDIKRENRMIEKYKEISGKGISCEVSDKKVLISLYDGNANKIAT